MIWYENVYITWHCSSNLQNQEMNGDFTLKCWREVSCYLSLNHRLPGKFTAEQKVLGSNQDSTEKNETEMKWENRTWSSACKWLTGRTHFVFYFTESLLTLLVKYYSELALCVCVSRINNNIQVKYRFLKNILYYVSVSTQINVLHYCLFTKHFTGNICTYLYNYSVWESCDSIKSCGHISGPCWLYPTLERANVPYRLFFGFLLLNHRVYKELFQMIL